LSAPDAEGAIAFSGELLQFPPPGESLAGYSVSRDGQRSAAITSGGQLRINGAIFTGELGTHSNQRFVQARWSPDGRWLAYVVQRWDAEQAGAFGILPTFNDGVWVVEWPGGRPRQVFRNYYIRGGAEPFSYRVAYDVMWSPDSSALLVALIGEDGTRRTTLTAPSVVVDVPGPGLGPQEAAQFTLLPLTDGLWLPNGSGWVATTTTRDQPVNLAIVRRGAVTFSPVINGLAARLWIQNPAVLPDGRIAFLGKPSFSGQLEGGATALRMYVTGPDGVPVALSEPLSGTLIGAEWSPNRAGLLAHVLDGTAIRSYLVSIDGSIQPVIPASLQIHWRQ
jgi:WD40 repeat protein